MAETAVAAHERTLPHNLDAERSVLGAILLDNEAFNTAIAIITSAAFFRDAHRRIFERMTVLVERRSAIDFVILREELARAGELEEVGGAAYLASLVDGVPRATNVEYYARIVKEKATLRSLIYAANKIVANAYEADQDADLILDDAEGAIFSVAEDRVKAGFVPMRQLVQESFPKIEKLFEHQSHITGVGTHLPDLDKMTRGFQPGDLVIVAARPSMGKTSLVLNVCQHVATHAAPYGHQRMGVAGVFSLEMSKEQLFMRMLASEAKIDSFRLLSGQIGQREYGQITHAMETLARGPALRRRLGRHRRAGDARQGPAPAGRARPRHPGRGLRAVDDRPRQVREPHPRTGGDLAVAQGPGQGTERADCRAVAAVPRARRHAPTSAPCCRTCVNPAPSSRTPTSSS